MTKLTLCGCPHGGDRGMVTSVIALPKIQQNNRVQELVWNALRYQNNFGCHIFGAKEMYSEYNTRYQCISIGYAQSIENKRLQI